MRATRGRLSFLIQSVTISHCLSHILLISSTSYRGSGTAWHMTTLEKLEKRGKLLHFDVDT